jgi:hypothetical protein
MTPTFPRYEFAGALNLGRGKMLASKLNVADYITLLQQVLMFLRILSPEVPK